MEEQILRPHAEDANAHELEALRKNESYPVPPNWQLSPRSVVTYVCGGKLADGTTITPKYFGNRRLIEIAVATLLTDRALMLIGVPGTAKTWVSEHLAAAISGDSKLLVQGTAGLAEDALRYGWNYARLLAEGPSEGAIVPSPLLHAMQHGKVARVEELSRISAEIQDTLITILSEKIMPIPELNREVQARRGFNIIATANDRDKGVNELSSALRRRFNSVRMPLPPTLEEEVRIVQARVEAAGKTLKLPESKVPVEELQRLITIFRELRSGQTADGHTKLKTPSSTLSTAEAISVVNNGLALAAYFGDGQLKAEDLAPSIRDAIIKDRQRDLPIWEEYLETILRRREGWEDLYETFKATDY